MVGNELNEPTRSSLSTAYRNQRLDRTGRNLGPVRTHRTVRIRCNPVRNCRRNRPAFRRPPPTSSWLAVSRHRRVQ